MSSTLHVVALPHTQTTAAFSSCAYTQKVRKFVKMMRAQGRSVILYGSEVTDVEADENVSIVPESERSFFFGDGFDTVKTPLAWDPAMEYWRLANSSAVLEIGRRAEKTDLLCLIAGWAQAPIADALPYLTVAEWGVGYEGVLPRSHRAFESSAWMHYVYGRQGEVNGRWYDTVIPNFFDRRDFRQGDGAGGYLLYLGRIVQRKGVEVALQIAERLERKLVVAGPGAVESGDGFVLARESTGHEVELRSPLLEHVGEVGVAERRELLAGAAALLAPTIYLEPFGGVAVEAMLSGTPAITSDYGAFPETVEQGVTGYRFRTLAQGAQAVLEAEQLDRKKIRRRALSRFSLEAVGPRFESWMTDLDGLWGVGWPA